MTTALVALGGTLGVLARYGISRLTLHSDALIWATVGINVVGSFLLGLLVAEQWFSRDVRGALGVGFLGGFTTFSTFGWDTAALLREGQVMRGMVYAAASNVLGIALVFAGYGLSRWRV
jgi:fluoride exporter